MVYAADCFEEVARDDWHEMDFISVRDRVPKTAQRHGSGICDLCPGNLAPFHMVSLLRRGACTAARLQVSGPLRLETSDSPSADTRERAGSRNQIPYLSMHKLQLP